MFSPRNQPATIRRTPRRQRPPSGRQLRMALFGLGALAAGSFVLSPRGAIGQTIYAPPPAPGVEAAAAAVGRIGRVSMVGGDVSYFAETMTPAQWIRAETNLPVPARSSLASGAGGRAEATFGSITVHLDTLSQADFAVVDDDRLAIGVARGAVAMSIPVVAGEQSVAAFGDNWRAIAREPGTYAIRVEPVGGDVVVKVHTGRADVEWNGSTLSVDAGRQVRLDASGRIIEAGLDDDVFDRWVLDRARQLAALRAPAFMSPALTGGEVLSQYGDWTDQPGHGSIWFPHVAAAGWAPYQAGRWVTMAPWGSVWVDAQPWGFATSHYGRWIRVDGRWGWLPGEHARRPVFAPRIVAPMPYPVPPRHVIWERPRFAPPPPRYMVPPVVIGGPRGGPPPAHDRWHDRRPDRPYDGRPIGAPPVHIEPPRAVVPPIRIEPPRPFAPPVRIEPPRAIVPPPSHVEPSRPFPPPSRFEPSRPFPPPSSRNEPPRPVFSPPSSRSDPPRPIAQPPVRVEMPRPVQVAPSPVIKPMPMPMPGAAPRAQGGGGPLSPHPMLKH